MTAEAKEVLAEQGYDPVFGARPLKRTIQRMIENPLAVEVLAGRFGEGDTIVVEPSGGETLRFRKESPRGRRELSPTGNTSRGLVPARGREAATGASRRRRT